MISDYTIPHPIFKNPDLQVIFARLFRPSKKVPYQRERISTLDDDFIDIDWSKVGSDSLAIVCPGLEGHSTWKYIISAVDVLNDHHIDSVVFNNRGCSGVGNKKYLFGIGDENDLALVIEKILEEYDYKNIYLAGYSTGGNLIAKYLADKSTIINSRIKKAFLISPTLDLVSTMHQFDNARNSFYNQVFILIMLKRLWLNRKTFNRHIKFSELFNVANSTDFYNKFCSHDINESFIEYLNKHSAYKHLHKIKIPTMIIHALDDSFINQEYVPYDQIAENPYLSMKVPQYGGHAGFVSFDSKYYWSEETMIEFLTSS